MHITSRAALLFALSATIATPAVWAQIPETARTAFLDGRFLIAANVAETDGSAEALAFAARARVADAIMHADGICIACLVRAEASAQAAIKRDPNFAEGYVQLAVAIGFRGRLLDTFEAQSEGLAEKGRAAIDRALELDPNNTWARASLGGWHLEIVHRAGSVLASILYGAYEDEGLTNFRKALVNDPGSLLLHYHFALSLLALDTDRFRDEALAALEAGAKDPRADALTAFTRARAEKLTQLLKSGGVTDEIAALVRHYQGYPGA